MAELEDAVAFAGLRHMNPEEELDTPIEYHPYDNSFAADVAKINPAAGFAIANHLQRVRGVRDVDQLSDAAARELPAKIMLCGFAGVELPDVVYLVEQHRDPDRDIRPWLDGPMHTAHDLGLRVNQVRRQQPGMSTDDVVTWLQMECSNKREEIVAACELARR
jgi:hypothetical protein